MILEHDKDNDSIMSRRYVVDDLRQDDALLEDDNRHLVVCRETLPELQAWLAMVSFACFLALIYIIYTYNI